jgi:DNA-binding SARP family transcriptional activator/TolB-like protein
MAVADHKGQIYLPRTRKTRALMAVLAMASPKPVLRVQLAAMLWSRRESEQARASLRQSVHELQDTLGASWSHLFVTDRHHLSLRGAELEIDALSLTQPTLVSVKLLERYEDVLLEDLSGLDPVLDRWLEDERGRFIRIRRTIGESILAQCDDPVAAIEAAEQMLSLDRRHEGAWRMLIRCHAERGDIPAALGAYERCRGVLAEPPAQRPSPETEDLIGRIRAQNQAAQNQAAQNQASQNQAAHNQAAQNQFAHSESGPTRSVHRGFAPLSEVRELASVMARPVGRREQATLRLRVLPMRTIGEDRDDGLALGLAEEISAGLSRFRWISCLPATLRPSGQAANAPGRVSSTEVGDAVWSSLEADLVLDGTIQRGLGRVRIIVRLVDMRSGGAIVWAGRFDRELTDVLALQDELGAAIVAQVDPELMQHEGRRVSTIGSHDLTAQDLLLQALPAIFRMERERFVNARLLLEMSLRADPGSSITHGWLAYWDLLYVGQGWADDPAASTTEAASLAERAVMLDPGDARALTLAGHVRGFLARRPEEANALHDRAIKLNPNLALAWCFSGLTHIYLGRHEEALRRINVAQRLSPSDPHGFFFDTTLTLAHLMRGDYASAVEAGRRAVEINPLFSSGYKAHLSALGWQERTGEAAEVLSRLLVLEPGFSVQEAVRRSPFSRIEDVARFADGLRRAGLREDAIPRLEQSVAFAPAHSVIDLIPEAPHSPVFGTE